MDSIKNINSAIKNDQLFCYKNDKLQVISKGDYLWRCFVNLFTKTAFLDCDKDMVSNKLLEKLEEVKKNHQYESKDVEYLSENIQKLMGKFTKELDTEEKVKESKIYQNFMEMKELAQIMKNEMNKEGY